jgi:hypothetical protein
MSDNVSPLVARFRLLYVFNAWVLSVAVGAVATLAWAGGAGIEAVPAWVSLAVIGDGALFACYFLLAAPVADHLGEGRSLPGPLARVVDTLERWDEAGRE